MTLTNSIPPPGPEQRRSRTPNEAVLERGTAQITYTEFDLFTFLDVSRQSLKKQNHNLGGHSGCQNEAVPERGKSHRAGDELEFLKKNVFKKKNIKK